MSAPERLRELMEARGLTIEAFAQLVGEKGPQRVKDVLRQKQRIPEQMLAAMQREGFDVGYVLTGERQSDREALLARNLGALRETTDVATSLELPAREGEFVRDVLYGVAVKNPQMLRETIENYVASRQPKPRKRSAK